MDAFEIGPTILTTLEYQFNDQRLDISKDGSNSSFVEFGAGAGNLSQIPMSDWQWKVRLHSALWSWAPPVLIPMGLACNLSALLVLLRPKIRRSQVVHLPLAVLAIVDCLALLTSPLRHWLRKASYFNSYYGNALDPQVACFVCCNLHELLLYLSLMLASWIVALVAVERFAAVCVSPGNKFRDFLVSRRGLAVTMATGFACLLGCNLHFLATRQLLLNSTAPKGYRRSCENSHRHEYFVKRVFPQIDLALTAFGPFIVILVCNSCILAKLRSVRRGSMLGSSESKLANYRTTVMLLLTSFAFVAFTSPVKLYLTCLGGPHPPADGLTPSQFYTYRIIWSVLLLLQFANHCCNFLFYCISNPLFRREAGDLLRCCCCCRSHWNFGRCFGRSSGTVNDRPEDDLLEVGTRGQSVSRHPDGGQEDTRV